MKMNKIIIPAAAVAMGIALVGSVSSTLAWYQYSTKAQAAFIGTSVGQSENLEIQLQDGTWKSNLTHQNVDALAGLADEYPEIIPVTPGISVAKNGAIPAKNAFKEGVETGVAGYHGDADSKNIIQFDLKIRYKKTAEESEYLAKDLKLSDLTIMNNADNTGSADLYKTIRVHFAVGSGADTTYYLFANDNDKNDVELTTQTYGPLDTDNDGEYDKALKYDWESNTDNIVYGNNGTSEVANNASKLDLGNNPLKIGTLPAGDKNSDAKYGLNVRVTIWLEGWQKLSGTPAGNHDKIAGEGNQPSSMWDPTLYTNQKFNVGMRFQADDIPAQNP